MIDFGADEDFIQNYQVLKSSRKMGEYYNCSKSAILLHAKTIRYDNSKNKENKIVKYPVEEVYKKYEELKSINKVGEFYHCSGTAVSNYLKTNGYVLNLYYKAKSQEKQLKELNKKERHYLTEEEKDYIINSYYLNISSNDLAKKFNIPRGNITKIWFDNNLCNKKTNQIKTTEIDLTGQTFGKWKVIQKSSNRSASGGIMWLCRCECGIQREVSSLSLRNGTSLSCGGHKTSKGNEKIKKLLMNANIPFEQEKKFPSCKDKKELPFDFYVNNQYLIEYDGIQHFQPTIFDYDYTHKHDIIKSKWCKENGIKLIRIPYTIFDNLKIEDLMIETSKFVE